MTAEKMRKEFEAWVIPAWSLEKMTDSEGDIVYVEDWVQGAWICWQASRAALVVELPKKCAYEQLDSSGAFACLSYELNPDSAGDTVELARLSDCRTAIESTGVKTK